MVLSFFNSTPIVYSAELEYNHPVLSKPNVESADTRLEVPSASTTTEGTSNTGVKCSCVQYLREVLGVEIHGDAKTQQPNITFRELQYGDVVILNYSGTWHVGMFVETTNEGILIKDSNYTPCTPRTRLIPFNDEALVGFQRPEVLQ